MSFTGFPADGDALLTHLPDLDKAGFEAARRGYRATILEPAKAFVTDMGERLAERVSPQIQALPKTNGSIAPINNDLRFSPEATPYKDHLMFRFWEGPNKKTAPTFMVRYHPTDGIGFATHTAFADVNSWRAAIDDSARGTRLVDALERLVAATGADVVGASLKRVPKPFEADHPRGDLLRHKMLQVRWIVSESTGAGGVPDHADPSLVEWCADELVRAREVHQWMVAELAQAA